MHDNTSKAAGASMRRAKSGQIEVFIPLIHTQTLEKAREAIKGRRGLYPQLSKLIAPPNYHIVNLLKIIFALLDYDFAKLGDPTSSNPTRFSWNHAKKLIDQTFVDKLLEFDPQHDDFVAEESKEETHRIEYMKRVFEKMLDKEVLDQGPAFTPLLKWAKTCVIIKDASLEQRERSKMLMDKGLL
jgi:hypothetical protein